MKAYRITAHSGLAASDLGGPFGRMQIQAAASLTDATLELLLRGGLPSKAVTVIELDIPDRIVGTVSADADAPPRTIGAPIAAGPCVTWTRSSILQRDRLLIDTSHPDYPRIGRRTFALDLDAMISPDQLHREAERAPASGLIVTRWPALVDASGQELDRNRVETVAASVKGLEDGLLSMVRAKPDLMHRMPPRDFERVIAEYYKSLGWQVELTPATRDGGRDLVIVKIDEAGRRMCLVECKRYAPDKPVRVAVIRSLYGVVEMENATAGIVITTSRFTAPAQEMQRSLASRLTLYDYTALVSMLKATGEARGRGGQ